MSNTLDELIAALFDTQRVIHERVGLKACGAHTRLQIEVLRYVANHHGPTMKDIATHLCVTPPSATAAIHNLVSQKLLVRALDRNDRRIVRLTLTAKGHKVLAEGSTRLKKHMRALFGVLSIAEQQQFTRLLQKLH